MTSATRSHIRIGIVDDHEIFRAGLRRLLSTEGGFEVVAEAADGHEASALVEAAHPDVLLLDVAMPYRNGLEVYLDLQNNSLTAVIPVIVCSAALTQREIQAWYSLPHVVEVMAKPFDINALMARIDAVCEAEAVAA